MDTDALAEALTMAGLEVESAVDRYAYLDSVVTGRITQIGPHPNSKGLTVCSLDVGDRELSIVCGAPNVKVGMIVPVAFPGTRFPGGFALEERPIHGVPSNGMVCSESELALGLDHSGIMDLGSEIPVGTPLAKALNLSDMVLEIDLTPNRPDCLSILGIAREIAALQHSELTYPDIPLVEEQGDLNDISSVTIDVPDHCPRYAAQLVTDIAVVPSPSWLQDRLHSVGLRPINNIVDVTNYVMMETGQPLHAFDFDQLAEQRIVVRLAHPGETFTTLDEKQHVLSSEMLMICDGEKPVALAGVMGGLNSEIEAGSSRVLIESACFEPTTTRKTAKKLGIPSEASHRFERGVDPNGTLVALNRAAQLIAEVGGGKIMGGLIDAHPKPTPSKRLRLGIDETNRFLGTDLKAGEIEDLLHSIEFDVTQGEPGYLDVVPPSFRVDVHRPVDLMEEVARLWGYNRIPTTHPMTLAEARAVDSRLNQRRKVKQILIGLGFSEAINYSFIHPSSPDRLRLSETDPRRKAVPVLNPLSEEQAVMRASLVPGILNTARKNISQQNRDLKLFEVGRAFVSKEDNKQPEETEMLVGLWTGARDELTWYGTRTECDFYDIKGAVEGLLDRLDISEAEFSAAPADLCRYVRRGYTTRIRIDDHLIGLAGQVHPEALDNYDIRQNVYIFELNLEMLLRHSTGQKQFRSISPYPATSRDVTLIVDKTIESSAFLKYVRDMNEALVEEIRFFDVFEGDPIPAGKKSVSFRIVYRSETETLADDHVNAIHSRLTEGILEAFDASFPT